MLQVEETRERLEQALQDLAAQCRQFAAFANAAPLTRAEALQAQMPVRGAANQALAQIEVYLAALSAYADSLSE